MRKCKVEDCGKEFTPGKGASRTVCRLCTNEAQADRVKAMYAFRDHSLNPLTMSWGEVGAC